MNESERTMLDGQVNEGCCKLDYSWGTGTGVSGYSILSFENFVLFFFPTYFFRIEIKPWYERQSLSPFINLFCKGLAR